MVYYQTVALRNLLEALIVVGIASARVFNAVDVTVVSVPLWDIVK